MKIIIERSPERTTDSPWAWVDQLFSLARLVIWLYALRQLYHLAVVTSG